MSANNELLIQKNADKWEVVDIDVDTGSCFSVSDKKFDSLEEAIECANEYMKENEVEYGLNVMTN